MNTEGRLKGIVQDGRDIFTRVKKMMLKARHEILLATYTWEESDASREIWEALKVVTREHPGIKVRILVDGLIWKSRKLCEALPLVLGDVAFGVWEHVGFEIQHSKMLVVDGWDAMVMGANVEKFFNFDQSWHDVGYVLQGPVAQALRTAFLATWHQCHVHPCGPPTPGKVWHPPQRLAGTVPMRVMGDRDSIHAGYWEALGEAKGFVNIQSPNVNDPELLQALKKRSDLNIRILTSYKFGDHKMWWPWFGGRNRDVLRDLPSHISVRWYVPPDHTEPVEKYEPGTSHAKYFSVDGRVAIVGSSNQDVQSWHRSHELNLGVWDETTARKMDQTVFEPAWHRSKPME